ncbi:MAG: endonuclease MutS2 [Acholeplasma sp.]|nr:endonuclease MutS2 [Acholeplasma sp.]
MRFSTKTLEFPTIIERIIPFAYSEKARSDLFKLFPSSNFDTIKRNLAMVNEMTQIVSKYGSIPFLENFDNNVLYDNKRIERVYQIDELLFIKLFLTMEKTINLFITNFSNKDEYKYLKDYLEFNDHKRILSVFEQTFTDNGEIFDDATKDLKTLRMRIKKLSFDLEQKIHKLLTTYKEYLSDSLIVTRNNRYCLSVKEGFKNKVRGVIHDVSSSKQTVFIEPEISLQYMAEIEMAKIEEEKEIFKILVSLTEVINNNIDSLRENLFKYIELDKIHAKAKYSLEINGVIPKINNQGVIDLINAKHPLIDPKKVVPISLKLSKIENMLLITGPNTGGKTVTLKTVGLLTIMMQSGVLVPVYEDSNMACFNNIFADIGDEQSIFNSLSTFSSHIANIINFLKETTDNSLILLDELGSGTDPNEGVALAIAIIEEFRKQEIRMIITSHYSELKTYAYETDGIITASVAFDKESLKPLYYLKHGISGESHARLIASRLGMPEGVINNANILYAKRETDLAKIISKLNDEREKLDEELTKNKELEKSYLQSKKDFEDKRNELIGKQKEEIEKIRQQELKKWAVKQDEIEELIQKIKLESSSKEHHIAELKGVISDLPEQTIINNTHTKIAIGDTVYINSYQQFGKVKDIKQGKYLVTIGIFDLEFEKKDLELKQETPRSKDQILINSKKKIQKKTSSNQKLSNEASLKLDLRGFRYEDVANAIDKAIDRALLSNLHSLRIIHGFGTGAVRNAVKEYIKKSPLISGSRYGGEGEGLNGVTIITLK